MALCYLSFSLSGCLVLIILLSSYFMYEKIKKQLFQLKSNKAFEALVVAVIIISALEIGAKPMSYPLLLIA